jgi:hypothetical protein
MPIVLRPPSEENASLASRLGSLGRVRRRVALAAAAMTLIGVVAGGALVAGFFDAWLHLGALVRAFALVLILAGAGIIALRILAALRLPSQPLALAMEIEERNPRFNDSLASAISFLEDVPLAEDRGISGRLRAAAVLRAMRLAERHDLGKLVPTGACWRAFWLCVAVLAAAAPLVLWDTERSRSALTRLADPFGAHPWPPKTRIEILVPDQLPGRMPKGAAFELQFAVHGVIPDRAAVTFLTREGEQFEEVYPLATAEPEQVESLPGHLQKRPVALVAARLDPGRLAQDFRFRIRANDNDTGWQSIAVVQPPRLVPLDGRPSPQVAAIPPAYTRVPPFGLPDGAAVIEVPLGTALTLRAASDVPLARAELHFQGDRSRVESGAGLAPIGLTNPIGALAAQRLADSIGLDVPLLLSGDSKRMEAAFTPAMTGMYVLAMTDASGLTGTRLLEIRLVPDPAPVVTLLRPTSGRDAPLLVPDAKLSVQISTEDRVYGLRRVFLEYRVGPDGRLRTIPLDSAAAARALPALVGEPASMTAREPQVLAYEFSLPVSAFRKDNGEAIGVNDTIFLRAAADDWDDVSILKQPGRSGEFEIRITTREAVDAFLQKELSALRPELARVREQQRDATTRTEDVKPQPDGMLTLADRERLLAAEQAQRQVRGRIADSRDGLRARAEMLRHLARANNLPQSNATNKAEVVADELARMADRDLAAIEPLLSEAQQAAGRPPMPGEDSQIPQLLTRTGRYQTAVEDNLSNLLDLLAQWGDAGAIRGDARLLRDAVIREAATANRMPEKVPPGTAPADLTGDERAELDRAAGRIDHLTDQASSLLGRASQLAGERDKAAAAARAAAEAKEKAAGELQKKAAGLLLGTPERREADRKIEMLKSEAADSRTAAARAAHEATALRKAIEAAGGQALQNDLRRAADAMRNNRQTEAANLERSAAARLDRLAAALEEKQDDVPELARKRTERWKDAADELDALGAAQDEIRQRADNAARIADPEERAAALRRLAPEQQKLLEQTRNLVQRLTREQAGDAARDARAALDKMQSARDDLDRGMNPAAAQGDATAKLDNARDRLDEAVASAPQELTDEKRRLLANQVKALLERQQAAIAEAVRIQEKVVAEKKWTRPLLASYADLEDRERALAIEVRNLADREFSELPVFARIIHDAADGMEKAADKAKVRREDALGLDLDAAFDPDLEKAADARVRRPMGLALRRLQHVLSALQSDGRKEKKEGQPEAKKGGKQPMPPMSSPRNSDVIPPLAQLKALRELQAELNRRTAEFAKAHPDRGNLDDDTREELKDIENAQREVAALFEEMAKLFEKQPPPDSDKPAEEKP